MCNYYKCVISYIGELQNNVLKFKEKPVSLGKTYGLFYADIYSISNT